MIGGVTKVAHFLQPPWLREAWWVIGLGAAMAVGTAWLLVHEGDIRLVIAIALLTFLGGLSLISPQAAIISTFVFLAVLGDFRRVLIPLTGWPEQDVLLLVGPAIALALAAFTVVGQPFRLNTPISRWMLALIILMLLQVANPLQGGLSVGMAGALFYLVPLMWFWIGRSYATPKFLDVLLYRVIVPLAVLAALLGLYQTFFSLLPFEQAWVYLGGYSALNVGGYVRPFSFFTSSGEYGLFLSAALIVLWASWMCRIRIGLALLPLLALALFLTSIRNAIVMVVFTAVLLWAMKARGPAVKWLRFAIGLSLAVGGLYLILLQVQNFGFAGRIGALVDHQVAGLLNPFDPTKSTAAVHTDMFVGGIVKSFSDPLGHGLGATTMGVSKFGGSGVNSEVDFSNMFSALGLAGGVVYAVIIVLVLLAAFRFWRSSRTRSALAILGILVMMVGGWLAGGHYLMDPLVWFCIGAVDRFEGERRGT